MRHNVLFTTFLALLISLSACQNGTHHLMPTLNPIAYVEIPVTDLARAMAFYRQVFGFTLELTEIDGYPMALLPWDDSAPGVSAALVQGDVYVPGKAGPVLYFRVASIDATLAKARAANATVLYAKKAVGTFGYVAEIEDSEGNRIALNEPAQSQ